MQKGARNLRVVITIIAFVVAINFVTMPAEEYPGIGENERAHRIRSGQLLLVPEPVA